MKFKQLLKQKGYTGYALAKALQVNVQTVYSWERGRCTPNPKTILNISEILKASVEDVLRCFIDD